VNEFLVVHLDSIDERLLDYLDEDGELMIMTAERRIALPSGKPRYKSEATEVLDTQALGSM